VPLTLAGLGVATGTLGAKIAWIRPWALGGLLTLLLGVIGWWMRKRFTSIRPAEDCCATVPRFPTLAVTILVASYVVAWASPHLLHAEKDSPLTALTPPRPNGGTLLVISTPQFECPPCVGTLQKTMAATPGVGSVQIDFDRRETQIVFQPGASIDTTLVQWKRELGFDGKEVRREIAPAPR
jgi:copper chaperone CopZ